MSTHTHPARSPWILGITLLVSLGLGAWLLFKPEAEAPSSVAPMDDVSVGAQHDAPVASTAERPDNVAVQDASPSRVIEAGKEEVLARSSAQPFLTLSFHLTERGKRLPWGERGKIGRQPNITFSRAMTDRQINPEGKELSSADGRELDKLLGQLDLEYENLWLEMCAARKEVLFRSIDAGRVRSLVLDAGPVDPWSNTDNLNRSKRAMSMQREAVAELTRQFGVKMKDWGYTNMSSSEPDGVSRMNLIYWTRADEPEFFRLQDACSALDREHAGRVRAFFEAR